MGSSTAQHDLGGSTCSDHKNAKSFDYTGEKKGLKTSKRSPQRQDLIIFFLDLLHLMPDLLVLGGQSKDLILFSCLQPPSQRTGSHKTEFIFDVRQFGVLQRARLHFSTPILYRAAKNHKPKNKIKI